MKLSRIALFIAAVFLAGCALPTTGVRSGSVRPTLGVQGAPEGAELYVDGLSMGPAASFDGIHEVLNVEEGAHRVEVRLNGRVVHDERIVMSSGESRVVHVSGGKGQ